MAVDLRTTGWHRSPRRRWQALCALLLAGASACCEAGQASASFKVKVDFLADPKDTGRCERSTRPTLPASVTIVCGSSTSPGTRPDSRFMLNMYRSGEFLGTVDGMMSTGTVTSWRVIHLVNREYLEIMVGW
jgi:hypothetical protein